MKMITQNPVMKMTKPIPQYITTPNKVETSLGNSKDEVFVDIRASISIHNNL
ncbi:MAG: hypothetical protein QNL05_02480 [Gammaproteobacteria bacterium]|nr:hypothetical protein [Gammaproteobacteria bacterium]